MFSPLTKLINWEIYLEDIFDFKGFISDKPLPCEIEPKEVLKRTLLDIFPILSLFKSKKAKAQLLRSPNKVYLNHHIGVISLSYYQENKIKKINIWGIFNDVDFLIVRSEKDLRKYQKVLIKLSLENKSKHTETTYKKNVDYIIFYLAVIKKIICTEINPLSSKNNNNNSLKLYFLVKGHQVNPHTHTNNELSSPDIEFQVCLDVREGKVTLLKVTTHEIIDESSPPPFFLLQQRFERPVFEINWSHIDDANYIFLKQAIESCLPNKDKKLIQFIRTEDFFHASEFDKYHYIYLREGEIPFFRSIKIIECSLYSTTHESSQIYFLVNKDTKQKDNIDFTPITGDLGSILEALQWENIGNLLKRFLVFKKAKPIRLLEFIRFWGWATGRWHIFNNIESNFCTAFLPYHEGNLSTLTQANQLLEENSSYHHQLKESNITRQDHKYYSSIILENVSTVRWNYIKHIDFHIQFIRDPIVDNYSITVKEKNIKKEHSAQAFDIHPFGFMGKLTPFLHKRKLIHYSEHTNNLKDFRSIAQCYSRGTQYEAYHVLRADTALTILKKRYWISDALILEEFTLNKVFSPTDNGHETLVFKHCVFKEPFFLQEFEKFSSLHFYDCRFEQGFWAPLAIIEGGLTFLRCYFGFSRKIIEENEDDKVDSFFYKGEKSNTEQSPSPPIALTDLSINLYNSYINGTIALHQCTFSGRIMASGIRVDRNFRIRGGWLGKRINTYGYHPLPFKKMSQLITDPNEIANDEEFNNPVNAKLYKDIMNNDWQQEIIPGISLEGADIKGDLEFVASCDEFHNTTNIEEAYKLWHSRESIIGDTTYICGHINAMGVKVGGSCYLTGLFCTGYVDFKYAHIKGSFHGFSKAAFKHYKILTPHCYIHGVLRLEDANIDGTINLSHTYIHGNSLLSFLKVKGDLHLTGATLEGNLNLDHSKINGYVTAFPKLELNQLDTYGEEQWKIEPKKYSTSDERIINKPLESRLLPKIWPYICRPLMVEKNIVLSGLKTPKVELRAIQVKGSLEATTGSFDQIFITSGLRYNGDSENPGLNLIPSFLGKIRFRAINVTDLVDLSGIVIFRNEQDKTTLGSAVRVTHSTIGGELRFNNEYTVPDLLSTFPDFKNPEHIDKLKEIDSKIETNSKIPLYTGFLPKVELDINNISYTFDNIYKTFLDKHSLWPQEQSKNYKVIFYSGLKDHPKIKPMLNDESKIESEKEKWNLNLYANTIDGKLDLRNIFVRGTINLNDSRVNRQCIMSSSEQVETHRRLTDSLKTRCHALSMEQFYSKGEIDLTGLTCIYFRKDITLKTRDSLEAKVDDFISARQLHTESNLLLFHPDHKSYIDPRKKDSESRTSTAQFQGGIVLDGATINSLALTHHCFNEFSFKYEKLDKNYQYNLSMNHITLKEFQLDNELYQYVQINLSESEITSWNFVKLIEDKESKGIHS